jgi:transketolase
VISSSKRLDQLCINTIRGLAMDAVQAANSGHPGMPMGAAAMAYALWSKHLRHNPKNPSWPNRDRFILSAGHGSMLLYSLLHLTGYDLPLEELKNFRQWGSMTPGHPENILTPGVEMATGPLGQGFATAVGMAIAERYLSATLGETVVDHYTYGICSDGDLMEGVSSEAASLAGHLKLGKLIFLYDDNSITIDGSTDLAFTEDVTWKFEAMGWHVLSVDGMDPDAVDEAISEAKEVTDAPSLIRCRTTIGFGSPNRAGTAKSHGEALGEEEVKLSKQKLGIPLEPLFHIDPSALAEFRTAVERGEELESEWRSRLPEGEKGASIERLLSGDLGEDWRNVLEAIPEKLATRAASGKVIQALSKAIPTLLGGSADLAGSVNTTQKDGGQFTWENPKGRNISFGVREHAMMAAVNGITLHGGCRAFAGTFLVFSDYCKPSLRLAALMETPSIFIFTHDSIGLGEDGPTHQPVEHLAGLRAIPNFNVMRPADANETVACWKVAMESRSTPTALILTRQTLPAITPQFDGNHPAEKGAYVLRESTGEAKCILVATGSEVQVAVAAADLLQAEGVPTRVVSMPSWLCFERQDEQYRESVLPANVPTVSVEAASTLGWCRYAQGHVGIDRFGASAPGPVAMEKFGFTPDNVAQIARDLLSGKKRPVSSGDQALSH